MQLGLPANAFESQRAQMVDEGFFTPTKFLVWKEKPRSKGEIFKILGKV